jgi:hypothetical protein
MPIRVLKGGDKMEKLTKEGTGVANECQDRYEVPRIADLGGALDFFLGDGDDAPDNAKTIVASSMKPAASW